MILFVQGGTLEVEFPKYSLSFNVSKIFSEQVSTINDLGGDE